MPGRKPINQISEDHDQISSNKVEAGLAGGDIQYQTIEVRIIDTRLRATRVLCPVMKPKFESRTGSFGTEIGWVS